MHQQDNPGMLRAYPELRDNEGDTSSIWGLFNDVKDNWFTKSPSSDASYVDVQWIDFGFMTTSYRNL